MVVLVLGGALVVGAGIALVTGGGKSAVQRGAFEDPANDQTVGQGSAPPLQLELGDILFADVRHEGDEILFEARLGAPIPKRIKGGALDLRWDISEHGLDTWILSANLDVGPNASIVSQESDYGASSFLDTLPGRVELQGDRFLIWLDPSEIPGWPQAFGWRLQATLDGKPGDPSSALAKDLAPDTGAGELIRK